MTTQQILQGVHDWTNGKIVYDISVAHPDGQGNPTPYADLTAALGNGGANIPEQLRKGGMSVKFIKGSAQSNDNKYIQARCMAQNFTTDVTQWQVVDYTPTENSKNLIESGGVFSELSKKVNTAYDMRNIINPDWVHKGGIWQGNAYRETGNRYAYTDLIAVNGQNIIAFPALPSSNVTFAVYNTNKQYLRDVKASEITTNVCKYEYQNGDGYIRINFDLNLSTEIHANYGDILNDYVPYNDNPIYGYISDLNNVINLINTHLQSGYIFAGVATPSTTPVSGKVFYLAIQAGSYTNFNNISVSQGLSILIYNGTEWSKNVLFVTDITPTENSKNLIESGGVFKELSKKVDTAYDMRNIINPEKIILGEIIRDNGTIRTGLGADYGYYSDYIKLDGQSVICSNVLVDAVNTAFAVYGSTKNLLRVVKNTDVFTPQDGDAYIRINFYKRDITTANIHGNYGTTLNDYTPYNDNPIYGYISDLDEQLKEAQQDIEEIQEYIGTADEITPSIVYSFHSIISKVICIGDSMTAGWRINHGDLKQYSYPTFLSRITNWTIENAASGGQTPIGWWGGEFPNYTYTDYEFAIIYLGQNDGFTDTLNNDTFDGTEWAENTSYSIGDKRMYNGLGWKCIEAHTSSTTFDQSKWTHAYTDYANTNTGCYCKIIEGMRIANPAIKIFMLSGTAVSDWTGTGGRDVILTQISERYDIPKFNIKNNPWINLLNTIYHPDESSPSVRDNIHYGTIGYNALARVIYAYLMKYIKENEEVFSSWPY